MNWISRWVSLAFQRTGSHTVQLWRSFNLCVGASRAFCYGMSASRFSALESTSRVVCAQGRRCVCGHWETAREWTLGHSRSALGAGFLWSRARLLHSCYISVFKASCYNRRSVRHQSKAHQNGEISQVNEMKKEIRQLNFGESLRFHGLSGNFDWLKIVSLLRNVWKKGTLFKEKNK